LIFLSERQGQLSQRKDRDHGVKATQELAQRREELSDTSLHCFSSSAQITTMGLSQAGIWE
jgi:hypothetical protein